MDMKLINKSVNMLTLASAEVLPQNEYRNYLIIHNPNDFDVWVCLDGAAVVGGAGSFVLFPGGTLTFESVAIPRNAVQAISTAEAATNLTIYEA